MHRYVLYVRRSTPFFRLPDLRLKYYLRIVGLVQLQGRWLQSTVQEVFVYALPRSKLCQIGRNASSVSINRAKIGLGSVESFRTLNWSLFDRDKTARIFEHQSRKLSGLVPSTLGIVPMADFATFPGSSMSVLDALFVSVCWSSFFSVYSSVVSVDLLERAVSPDLVLVQLGRVYRSLEACRTILSGFFSFNPVASVDRLKGADLSCRASSSPSARSYPRTTWSVSTCLIG